MKNSLLFSTSLKINYDSRFLESAVSLIRGLAEMSGADNRELYHLSMLTEESTSFIIGKYTGDIMIDQIEISYLLYDDGNVILEFTDKGSPILKDKIPELNFDDESSLDGLWFHIVKQISDNFEIINRLNHGWVIRISKKLKNPTFEIATADDTQSVTNAEPSKLLLRQAKPEDAPQLVELAFMTYRYSNSILDFYDIDKLAEYIKNGSYDIFVVESNGKIIGASSTKYMDYDPKAAELGSAMVHPAYRGTRAFGMLIKEHNKQHEENPREVDYFVTYLVTTHPRSQKAVEKVGNGYTPLSISLNMIPRPEYIGLKKISSPRESLLNSYHPNGKLKVDEIFIAENHREIVSELLTNTGNEIPINTSPSEPEEEFTNVFNIKLDMIGSAIMIIGNYGKDWFTVITKALLNLNSAGFKTVIISLPTSSPMPREMDIKLNELGILFCGLSLSSLDEMRQSYVYTSEVVAFEEIEIYNPSAQKLLKHIEKQYQANK